MLFVSFRKSESEEEPSSPGPDLTQEERDARTVLCMQLSARVTKKALKQLFCQVGKVCLLQSRVSLKCVRCVCIDGMCCKLGADYVVDESGVLLGIYYMQDYCLLACTSGVE